MKTKTIPFDLETAKKIQAGKIKGKVIYLFERTQIHRILCTDRKHDYNVVFTYMLNGQEHVHTCDDKHIGIELEVPDNEPQFKPFDKVLVREDKSYGGEPDTWVISFFMDESISGYRVLNGQWFDQCIPYEGNEHLLGTTDKPKEN